jgi:NAD(P)-dependent dehydrogenase (short-subunit alcohol dehydrogenase family)
MSRLEGKIALITGGNSGIGLATAKQFVSEGAYVFVTGRRDSELAAAVEAIGRNVTGVQGDVSNLADLDLYRLISAGAQKRVRYSLYARATPPLRSSTVPRFTMMCMWGKILAER